MTAGVIIAWVLIVIAAILLLLLLTLSVPVFAEISYKDKKAEVYIKYLFVKKRLYPAAPKKKNKKLRKEKAETKEENKKPKRKKDIFEKLSGYADKLASGGRAARTLLSLISVKVRLNLAVSGQNAAECAINVGKYSAYVHSLLGVFANIVRLKGRNINIYPAYDSDKTDIDLFVKARLFSVNVLFNGKTLLSDLLKLVD